HISRSDQVVRMFAADRLRSRVHKIRAVILAASINPLDPFLPRFQSLDAWRSPICLGKCIRDTRTKKKARIVGRIGRSLRCWAQCYSVPGRIESVLGFAARAPTGLSPREFRRDAIRPFMSLPRNVGLMRPNSGRISATLGGEFHKPPKRRFSVFAGAFRR